MVCDIQYGHVNAEEEECLFLLLICDGTSSFSVNSIAFAIRIRTDQYWDRFICHIYIYIPIRILTYGSITVCLYAFPIFVAFPFTYHIPHIWNPSFGLVDLMHPVIEPITFRMRSRPLCRSTIPSHRSLINTPRRPLWRGRPLM